MRAVNLMPVDARTFGARGAGGPIGAYVLIAGLAVLVVFASVWTMTGRQVDDRSAQLDRVNAQARAAETRVAAAGKYEQFAELARNRVATVTSLSTTRFDWANALRELSRVLPLDVWLMQLTGTSGSADAAPTPGTSAAPSPSVEIQGCTRSQAEVARLLARLRAVDGVRSVELTSSTKPDTTGNADCPAGRSRDPIFTIVVRFAVPGDSKPAVDSTGQIVSAVAAAPASGSPASSAPASSAPASSAPASSAPASSAPASSAPASSAPAAAATTSSAPNSGAASVQASTKGAG